MSRTILIDVVYRPALFVDKNEDLTIKFSYIWTVLKLTLHITRTIWVSCLSHFLPGDVNASRAKSGC
jgi:hypothetical protein